MLDRFRNQNCLPPNIVNKSKIIVSSFTSSLKVIRLLHQGNGFHFQHYHRCQYMPSYLCLGLWNIQCNLNMDQDIVWLWNFKDRQLFDLLWSSLHNVYKCLNKFLCCTPETYVILCVNYNFKVHFRKKKISHVGIIFLKVKIFPLSIYFRIKCSLNSYDMLLRGTKFIRKMERNLASGQPKI